MLRPYYFNSTATASITTACWNPVTTMNLFDVTGSTTSTTASSYPAGYIIVPPGYDALPRLRRPAIIPDRAAVLERSLSLFRRLRPASELQQFLDGNRLRLRGRRFDYQVRKTRNLLTHDPASAHVPYELILYKKNGRPVARGCVIVPGTPVIDQLLALMFHVEDETEELNFLRATNWTPQLAGDDISALIERSN